MKFYDLDFNFTDFIYLNMTKLNQKLNFERSLRRSYEKLAEKFRGENLYIDLSPPELVYLLHLYRNLHGILQKKEAVSKTEISTRRLAKYVNQLEELLIKGGQDVSRSDPFNDQSDSSLDSPESVRSGEDRGPEANNDI